MSDNVQNMFLLFLTVENTEREQNDRLDNHIKRGCILCNKNTKMSVEKGGNPSFLANILVLSRFQCMSKANIARVTYLAFHLFALLPIE